MGIRPRESNILRWIKIKWQSKAPFDLRLYAKGFFTVIFEDLDDHKCILHNGPYFMNNVELFMRHWQPCYSSENEQSLATPIYVSLYSLPEDLWEWIFWKQLETPQVTLSNSQISLGIDHSPPALKLCLHEHITIPLRVCGNRVPR